MKVVKTVNAPEAIGPYSQAVVSNDFVFCSGQIPLNVNGDVVEGDVSVQVSQVLNNLKEVLVEAGSSIEKVVKTTIYLSDINDFALVNEVYETFFNYDVKPARATIEVSRLPKDVKVEIDCIATL